MGKYLWLGRYELIRDNEKKFSHQCSIDATINKRIVGEAGKPDKVALWNFICNPRDNLMIIGWHNPPVLGYENIEYMTFFQRLHQRMWKIFEPIFSRYLPIVSISEAKDAGLYKPNCLKEQFPGPTLGSAPGYSGGSFKKRQIGGWRWFSLIIDDETWEGDWHKEVSPKKLSLKDKIAETTAPKYYNPYIFKKGKWREKKNGSLHYMCPSRCSFIPRRYSVPVVVGNEDSTDFIDRYKRFTNIILKELQTQWTLNVWNILSFDYKSSDISETITIKPEIFLDLGWIETYKLGKKQWGGLGEGLHRLYESVYTVKVGLPNDHKIELQPIIAREKNPIWDGTPEGVAKILEEPYSKLVDLACLNLNKLVLDSLSQYKPNKRTIF